MNSLKNKCNAISVKQLDKERKNTLLDVHAQLVPETVINGKLGESRYDVGEAVGSEDESQGSDSTMHSTHFPKRPSPILGLISCIAICMALIGCGSLQTPAKHFSADQARSIKTIDLFLIHREDNLAYSPQQSDVTLMSAPGVGLLPSLGPLLASRIQDNATNSIWKPLSEPLIKAVNVRELDEEFLKNAVKALETKGFVVTPHFVRVPESSYRVPIERLRTTDSDVDIQLRLTRRMAPELAYTASLQITAYFRDSSCLANDNKCYAGDLHSSKSKNASLKLNKETEPLARSAPLRSTARSLDKELADEFANFVQGKT